MSRQQMIAVQAAWSTLAMLVVTFTRLDAQGQPPEEAFRFSLTKEVARHNVNVELINDFDSSAVKYHYGEIRVDVPNDTQFVFIQMTRNEYFDMLRDNYQVARGTAIPGPDRELGRLTRSQPFIYPKDAELVFFRRMFCETWVRYIQPTAFERRPVRTWLDRWSVAKPNDVLDTTEFVLELVDESTDERIIILDSVGIMSVRDQAVLERYGTFPDQCVRRVRLPESHAGRRVYVRPLPYRWGKSPLGLAMRKFVSDVNSAALFYDEHRVPLVNLPRYIRDDKWYPNGKCAADTMRLSLSYALVRHISEEHLYGGCIRPFFATITSPLEYDHFVADAEKARKTSVNHLNCHELARADTAWILSTLLPEPNRKNGLTGVRSGTASLLLRCAAGVVYATLNGTKSQRNKFVAYDVNGAEIFRGTFPPAPFENVQVPLPDAVTGNVFIRCITSDGYEVSALVARVL